MSLLSSPSTTSITRSRVFLRAEWRKLAIANYLIDPALLISHLPYGTELDLWNGQCLVSLVGFMFKNTRLKGVPVPFHTNFEEVNLRFYVRRPVPGGWRRGVVFIKEIVPKPALAIVANTIYGENYETMSMRHTWTTDGDDLIVEYAWKKKDWNSFRIVANGTHLPISPDSGEEFITEHYWGYTRLSAIKTSEYEVEHPTWNVYPVKTSHVNVDFERIYGAPFRELTHEKPVSVFLAEGSEVIVRGGKPL